MLTGIVVTLGNVSYGSFPSANELSSLSSNLIHSFIEFMRTIGIGSPVTLVNTLKDSTLEEIEFLFRKSHLNTKQDLSTIDVIIGQRQQWQSEILGGDQRKYEIDMSDILSRTLKRNSFFRYDAVETEIRNRLFTMRKAMETRDINESPSQATLIDQSKIERIIKSCKLRPIRAWNDARSKPEYLRILLTEIFPHTPMSVVAKYLFTVDCPTPQAITYYCHQHSIRRHPQCNGGFVFREEQLAFVEWTGHDTDQFIADQATRFSAWRHCLPNH